MKTLWLMLTAAVIACNAPNTASNQPPVESPGESLETPPGTSPIAPEAPTDQALKPPNPGPSDLGEVAPASQLWPAGTTSISFAVRTKVPSLVRADSSDKPFSSLALIGASSDGLTHRFTLKVQANQPYSFVIKAAAKSNLGQPYTVVRRVNYRVPTAYNPPFPRIFTLWWPKWGDWTAITSNNLSKLSVAIFNQHGYGTPDGYKPIAPSVFNGARAKNPNLRILTQFYSTYGCSNENAMCDQLEKLDADPSKPAFFKKVFLRNADGTVWKYNPHKVYNFANPALVAWLVTKNLELWRNDLGTFDGAFMDNCWRGLSGVNDGGGFGQENSIDLDSNGVADDPKTRDRNYELGLQDFLRALRAGMPNAMILCNAISRFPDKTSLHVENQPLTDRNGQPFNYADVVNGNEFEGELAGTSEGQWPEFSDLMAWYKSWDARAKPSANMVPNTGQATPDKAIRTLRQMRFSLASALMGNGVFLHGGWEYYTWFDEYDVKLGYAKTTFGTPISGGSPVWRRDFDGGIALVNSSKTQAVTVDLGGTYKAIQGTQDPSVNNGGAVSSVTIPPLDGRILLR
jgi:hypothetical protein